MRLSKADDFIWKADDFIYRTATGSYPPVMFLPGILFAPFQPPARLAEPAGVVS
jgi:hypothetical protein